MKMSHDVLKRQVRWQMRRGLLELDIMLTRFIANGFDDLNEQELHCLAKMLQWPDHDFLQVLQGAKPVEDSFQAAIVSKIRTPQCP